MGTHRCFFDAVWAIGGGVLYPSEGYWEGRFFCGSAIPNSCSLSQTFGIFLSKKWAFYQKISPFPLDNSDCVGYNIVKRGTKWKKVEEKW